VYAYNILVDSASPTAALNLRDILNKFQHNYIAKHERFVRNGETVLIMYSDDKYKRVVNHVWLYLSGSFFMK
jgi:hypothetical protein